MPSGYDTFLLFHAINLHFSQPSYDYFKYHGKTNVTPNAWYQRNDRYHFEVLGSKFQTRQLIGIFVSFFVCQPRSETRRVWGADLNRWAITGYPRWLAEIEHLPKQFEEDLNILKQQAGSLKQVFHSSHQTTPPILSAAVNKQISVSTVTILTTIITDAIATIDEHDQGFGVWDELKNLVVKYRGFLEYDKKKYTEIVKRVFLS